MATAKKATTKKAETEAKAEAKTAAKKAEPAKKTATKKAETAKKAETKKTETVKKAATKKTETATKTAAKKAPAKKAAAKDSKFELYIQYGGATVDVKDIEANVKKVVANAKDYKVYVKPDESKAYIVADGETTGMDVFFCE